MNGEYHVWRMPQKLWVPKAKVSQQVVWTLGAFSFNGNKLYAGGGGVIVSNNIELNKSKVSNDYGKRPHAFEYFHDELGYNFRMPNVNAALLLAQLEKLEDYRVPNRRLRKYQSFLKKY